MKYRCKCCDFLTLEEEPKGTFEVCPVCFWEDDIVQSENPEYNGGANIISLNEAKKNFLNFGCMSKEFKSQVRPPNNDEY